MQHNKVEDARRLIENLGQKERTSLSRGRNRHGHAPLFVAAQLGHVEFVNFLLEECYAKIGRYYWRTEMTPLLHWAVDAGNFVLVRTLVQHGADINVVFDQQTPVHAACDKCNIAVVRFLIENGADIHCPDTFGTTCLMKSVDSVELCRFLIEQGASVNAVNKDGNTALHSAIVEYPSGSLDTVRLLLEHGIDMSLGNDVLLHAARCCRADILEYLIEKMQPPARRRADMYSFIGAELVNGEYGDTAQINDAMKFWWKSANIKTCELTADSATDACISPNSAYNYAVEFHDIDSLAKIAGDKDAVFMQALVIRERILGPRHPDTIERLVGYAEDYFLPFRMHTFQRGFDLLRYAYQVSHDYIAIRTLVRFFKQHSTNIPFRYVFEALSMMVAEVSKMATDAEDVAEIAKAHECCIYFIDLLHRLMSTETDVSAVMQLVRALVETKSRTQIGSTLLHRAVSLNTNFLNIFDTLFSTREDICMSGSAIVECLLTAGAAVNVTDVKRNTPLHVALLSEPYDVFVEEYNDWLKVIRLLIRFGAHLDMRNAWRQVAAKMLPSAVTVDVFSQVSLQCLAARAVRVHKVPYRDIVPSVLVDFIDCH